MWTVGNHEKYGPYVYEGDGTPIAIMRGEDASANAQLIAAAPEMYELLELCGDVLEAVEIENKAYGFERDDVSTALTRVDALLRRVKEVAPCEKQ